MYKQKKKTPQDEQTITDPPFAVRASVHPSVLVSSTAGVSTTPQLQQLTQRMELLRVAAGPSGPGLGSGSDFTDILHANANT